MSLETYECSRCGAAFGIAGENTGSDDDYAADEYYASEVEFHESGRCPSKLYQPAPVIPGAAADALAMSDRLADIAVKLRDLGIKPSALSVGWGYLWGLGDGLDARDRVEIHAHDAADFLAIEREFGLSRAEIERDEIGNVIGNVYASGLVAGIAVMAFQNAEAVLTAEAVSA